MKVNDQWVMGWKFLWGAFITCEQLGWLRILHPFGCARHNLPHCPGNLGKAMLGELLQLQHPRRNIPALLQHRGNWPWMPLQKSSCDLLFSGRCWIGVCYLELLWWVCLLFPLKWISRVYVASPVLEMPRTAGKGGLVLPSPQAHLWQGGWGCG